MCVIVRNKYVPLMLRTAYRATGIRVNMLKNNIEIDIEEIPLMFTRTENDFIDTYSIYRHFQSRYLVETMNILPS
jgi:tRNA splicing endonuclease